MSTDTEDIRQNKNSHAELVIDDGRIEKMAEFTSPNVLYEELIARVKKYHPSDDKRLIILRLHFMKVRNANPESRILSIRCVLRSYLQTWKWIRRRSRPVSCMMLSKIR